MVGQINAPPCNCTNRAVWKYLSVSNFANCLCTMDVLDGISISNDQFLTIPITAQTDPMCDGRMMEQHRIIQLGLRFIGMVSRYRFAVIG
jgi:hypothetical protein